VNAAFVLVTAAWLAGQNAPPEATKPAAPTTGSAAAPAKIAPAYPGPAAAGYHGCGCSSCCDDCCDKPSWRDRMRGWFHRDSCCDECDSCGGHGHAWGGHHDCGCASSCNDCCEKPSLRDRMRGWFHRDSCCDECSGCSSCGAAPAVAAPGHAAPEQLKTAPSPLPKGTTEPKKGSTERGEITPAQPPLAVPATTTLLLDR
jgi:hypothetical protein